MSRLIDADALKDAHIKCPAHISFFDFGEIVELFLQTIDEQPTVAASPWHRVEEPPKDGQCCLFLTIESGRPERDAWVGIYRNDWKGDIDMIFDYWMPIEPPKEDMDGEWREG